MSIAPNRHAWHVITTNRKATCGTCGDRIGIDELVYWQPGRRNPRHVQCHERVLAVASRQR